MRETNRFKTHSLKISLIQGKKARRAFDGQSAGLVTLPNGTVDLGRPFLLHAWPYGAALVFPQP